VIVDQRYGLIHRIITSINNNHGVRCCDFRFSPDGRLLVSTNDDGIVKIWDTNIAGKYE